MEFHYGDQVMTLDGDSIYYDSREPQLPSPSPKRQCGRWRWSIPG
ncbi:MAG: hypothetical protein R2864_07540 [Syntrophotaleaceae bacterium]